MADLAWWFVAALIFVVAVYMAVRSASAAYFRTKLEYLRASLKEMTKGDH